MNHSFPVHWEAMDLGTLVTEVTPLTQKTMVEATHQNW